MAPSIALVIEPITKDLGEFTVARLLPDERRQRVGPFIFFDHIGPAEFAPGKGVNVRTHPHIGLATVTYLFDGEMLHRDSLGFVQVIRAGAVNWMTAGMLILGVPAMYGLRHTWQPFRWRRWCCGGMLVFGVPGMLVGMLTASTLVHGSDPGLTATGIVLLDMAAMLLGMAVGMLVPHALGHLLCGASSSS